MTRGDGSVNKRTWRTKAEAERSAWVIQYYAPDPKSGRSRLTRESGFGTEKEAHELGLKQFVGPRAERVAVNDLLDALLVDYEVRGLVSTGQTRNRLKHIRAFMGEERAAGMRSQDVTAYQAYRKQHGAAPATINLELSSLRTAYRMAMADDVLASMPRFRLLPVKNARQVFVSRAEFMAVEDYVRHRSGRYGQGDPDTADFLQWFFWTGQRPKSIKSYVWPALDLESWTLRLHPADDKVRQGVAFPLTGVYSELMERRLERQMVGCPLIFHRGGKPIGRFAVLWRSACREAGVVGKIPYDLRKTAARNMIRANVPEGVVMAIMGWKTRSMMDRYNITSEADKLDAQGRVERYVESLPTERNVVPMRRSRGYVIVM